MQVLTSSMRKDPSKREILNAQDSLSLLESHLMPSRMLKRLNIRDILRSQACPLIMKTRKEKTRS